MKNGGIKCPNDNNLNAFGCWNYIAHTFSVNQLRFFYFLHRQYEQFNSSGGH